MACKVCYENLINFIHSHDVIAILSPFTALCTSSTADRQYIISTFVDFVGITRQEYKRQTCRMDQPVSHHPASIIRLSLNYIISYKN